MRGGGGGGRRGGRGRGGGRRHGAILQTSCIRLHSYAHGRRARFRDDNSQTGVRRQASVRVGNRMQITPRPLIGAFRSRRRVPITDKLPNAGCELSNTAGTRDARTIRMLSLSRYPCALFTYMHAATTTALHDARVNVVSKTQNDGP